MLERSALSNLFFRMSSEVSFVVAKARQNKTKIELEIKWKHFNREVIGEQMHRYFLGHEICSCSLEQILVGV